MVKPFVGVIAHWRFNAQDKRIHGICLFYNGTSPTIVEGMPMTTSEVVEIRMVQVGSYGKTHLMAETLHSRYLLVD